MLTDIFAIRYQDTPICGNDEPLDMRLVVQACQIVLDDLLPARTPQLDETAVAAWRSINARVCRELGLNGLEEAPALVSDLERAQWREKSPDELARLFLTRPQGFNQADSDIKQRFSLVEVAMRHVYDRIQALNERIRRAEEQDEVALFLLETSRAELLVLTTKHKRAADELNVRLAASNSPLTYHNGFFQLATSRAIETQVASPTWSLLGDPTYKNIDIDLKEAIDRRDNNGRDAALYATKALESAIKIISDKKGLTRGNENGAAAYIDNLVSQSNGRVIEVWQSEALKEIFRQIRNPHGHGPGAAAMPTPSLRDVDWVISTCMTWIRFLLLTP